MAVENNSALELVKIILGMMQSKPLKPINISYLWPAFLFWALEGRYLGLGESAPSAWRPPWCHWQTPYNEGFFQAH